MYDNGFIIHFWGGSMHVEYAPRVHSGTRHWMQVSDFPVQPWRQLDWSAYVCVTSSQGWLQSFAKKPLMTQLRDAFPTLIAASRMFWILSTRLKKLQMMRVCWHEVGNLRKVSLDWTRQSHCSKPGPTLMPKLHVRSETVRQVLPILSHSNNVSLITLKPTHIFWQ